MTWTWWLGVLVGAYLAINVAALALMALAWWRGRLEDRERQEAADHNRILPPAHPQCRCVLVPELTDAQLDTMVRNVNARIRQDLLEPSSSEVDAVLLELERLSSSEE